MKNFLLPVFVILSYSSLFAQLSIPLWITDNNPQIGATSNTILARFTRTVQNSSADFLIYGYPDTDQVYPHLRKSVMLYATSDAKDMVVFTSDNIRFVTDNWTKSGDEKMRITKNGQIGIGTSNPLSKVHIKGGDIYMEDISSGVIMKSPNGHCWRMAIDNNSNPITTQISCPEVSLKPTSEESQRTIILNSSNKNIQEIKIYPNPVQNGVYIDFSFEREKDINIQLMDQNGRIIKTKFVQGSALTETFDLENLPRANYYLKFDIEGQAIQTFKIQKIK